jgi:hypothetical protein
VALLRDGSPTVELIYFERIPARLRKRNSTRHSRLKRKLFPPREVSSLGK